VLEHDVLGVPAARDTFLTANQVLGALDRDLAYTTVLTVLSRLHEKGLVERTRRGRAHTYWWIPAAAELAAQRMGRLLDAEHNRAAVLARFVDWLSADDESLRLCLLRRQGQLRPLEGTA
jgi:predicted transcriptional regulator